MPECHEEQAFLPASPLDNRGRPYVAADCEYCPRQEARAQLARTVATLRTVNGEAGWLPLTPSQVQEEQEQDATLAHVRDCLVAGRRSEWADVAALYAEMKAYHSQRGGLEVRGGVLYRRWWAPSRGADLMQLLVPRALRSQVLQLVHGATGAGHFRNNKTLRRLRGRFYWLGCRRDVGMHVHCCDSFRERLTTAAKVTKEKEEVTGEMNMEKEAEEVVKMEKKAEEEKMEKEVEKILESPRGSSMAEGEDCSLQEEAFDSARDFEDEPVPCPLSQENTETWRQEDEPRLDASTAEGLMKVKEGGEGQGKRSSMKRRDAKPKLGSTAPGSATAGSGGTGATEVPSLCLRDFLRFKIQRFHILILILIMNFRLTSSMDGNTIPTTEPTELMCAVCWDVYCATATTKIIKGTSNAPKWKKGTDILPCSADRLQADIPCHYNGCLVLLSDFPLHFEGHLHGKPKTFYSNNTRCSMLNLPKTAPPDRQRSHMAAIIVGLVTVGLFLILALWIYQKKKPGYVLQNATQRPDKATENKATRCSPPGGKRYLTTSYREEFRRWDVPRRERFKPLDNLNLKEAKFQGITSYQASYGLKAYADAWADYRPGPKVPEYQPFQGLAPYALQYPVKPPERQPVPSKLQGVEDSQGGLDPSIGCGSYAQVPRALQGDAPDSARVPKSRHAFASSTEYRDNYKNWPTPPLYQWQNPPYDPPKGNMQFLTSYACDYRHWGLQPPFQHNTSYLSEYTSKKATPIRSGVRPAQRRHPQHRIQS
ncbi:hypothetical protein AAFF_G00195850 [Aldrovandia affinis]|uniref:Gypsy retrotransposon integrase-like protein 1 n=1 Tax=Aldrovandia affinis TaxID=143900 RepID=A0AAD7RJ79_9TELE|nr:hypothetical protein AAFF_G00195850 [Aldrovandia affinis]